MSTLKLNTIPGASKFLLVALALGLGHHLFSAQSPKPRKQPQPLKLKVINCHDGDTCLAQSSDGLKVKLRLIGVDAPEVHKTWGPSRSRHSGQAFGSEARAFLNQVLKDQNTVGLDYGYDRFGRKLFWFTSPPANQQLIEEGFAWVYKSPELPKETLKDLERRKSSAQSNKKGIWSQKNPEDPKIFRKSRN